MQYVVDVAIELVYRSAIMMRTASTVSDIPADYSERIKRLRQRFGLTQVELAQRLGVSFTTVNRWENGQTRPSPLAWSRLQRMDGGKSDATISGAYASGSDLSSERSVAPPLDFTAPPEAVRVLAEGERLSFGHMFNPAFATEISQIDPLPHQRIAVYEHMLKQSPLRFLLADDAGAGKTIMSGLYIREMKSRRLLRRILIVVPAGLIGNWRSELATLFSLQFTIITGADAKNGNPFVGERSDSLIISVDTLAGSRMFACLRAPDVEPYDLIIFDEAHKLSVDRGSDLRVSKTDRYRLAEGLCSVPDAEPAWRLPWVAHHVLLLTATPHQGKDYPYYALWRLLDPQVLSTPKAFEEYPPAHRQAHFIRRTKEEMVQINGQPLYPRRISDTLGYDLTQGPNSEQALYDQTTDYMRHVYNRAKILNRSAAQMAMSVLQRRLASSTYALLRSLEHRIEKLDGLIRQMQTGELTQEQFVILQRNLEREHDVLDTKTADEEDSTAGREEGEISEDGLLAGVLASSLAELIAEREEVASLRDLARNVYEHGGESKFDKLREVLTDDRFAGEKFIIFTEHRDTLNYLIKRLGGMGYTEQIARIHGGMDYIRRQEQVERFRRPNEQGGAQFMICTDAAAEGINLQFCWIMINFDVPWNPARLEQRMGRIHRYGQKHDPVQIVNLVAPKTREGLVLQTLLAKLETIRKALGTDKVYDSIGRLFEGVSLRTYMERAATGDAATIANELDGKLTAEQVVALAVQEKRLYGDGGDVKRRLPELRQDLQHEAYRRLLPGYVRNYIENAAPLVGVEIDGDMNGCFTFKPAREGAVDPLLHEVEFYPAGQRACLSVIRPSEPRPSEPRPSESHPSESRPSESRPSEPRPSEPRPSEPRPSGSGISSPVDKDRVIWLHPGEPVFERFRAMVSEHLQDQARRGAVFVDPITEKPYLFHLALVSVLRRADHELPDLAREETLDCRLVGIKQFEGAEITQCPVEHLLLLKGGHGLPPEAQRLAMVAEKLKEQAIAYAGESVARALASQRRQALLATLPQRQEFIRRGFAYQEAELAAARVKQAEKARTSLSASGTPKAINSEPRQSEPRQSEPRPSGSGATTLAAKALNDIKDQQKSLAQRRAMALASLHREPDLIAPGNITFLAHALVVPSTDAEDVKRHDAEVEKIAMDLARLFEEAAGAVVKDVHTPELSRAAGLSDDPGFDLLSIRGMAGGSLPNGRGSEKAIEVKGRAGTGDVEVSANEWARAANLRDGYWLYVVYDCATPAPRLMRVRDPFGRLLAKAKGSVLISARKVLDAQGDA
jgi:superfamily II DNA or RNA helicase/transcriptional regulator with XRE-family HTH domain